MLSSSRRNNSLNQSGQLKKGSKPTLTLKSSLQNYQKMQNKPVRPRTAAHRKVQEQFMVQGFSGGISNKLTNDGATFSKSNRKRNFHIHTPANLRLPSAASINQLLEEDQPTQSLDHSRAGTAMSQNQVQNEANSNSMSMSAIYVKSQQRKWNKQMHYMLPQNRTLKTDFPKSLNTVSDPNLSHSKDTKTEMESTPNLEERDATNIAPINVAGRTNRHNMLTQYLTQSQNGLRNSLNLNQNGSTLPQQGPEEANGAPLSGAVVNPNTTIDQLRSITNHRVVVSSDLTAQSTFDAPRELGIAGRKVKLRNFKDKKEMKRIQKPKVLQQNHVDMALDQKQNTTDDEEVMTRGLNSQISNKNQTEQKTDSIYQKKFSFHNIMEEELKSIHRSQKSEQGGSRTIPSSLMVALANTHKNQSPALYKTDEIPIIKEEKIPDSFQEVMPLHVEKKLEQAENLALGPEMKKGLETASPTGPKFRSISLNTGSRYQMPSKKRKSKNYEINRLSFLIHKQQLQLQERKSKVNRLAQASNRQTVPQTTTNITQNGLVSHFHPIQDLELLCKNTKIVSYDDQDYRDTFLVTFNNNSQVPSDINTGTRAIERTEEANKEDKQSDGSMLLDQQKRSSLLRSKVFQGQSALISERSNAYAEKGKMPTFNIDMMTREVENVALTQKSLNARPLFVSPFVRLDHYYRLNSLNGSDSSSRDNMRDIADLRGKVKFEKKKLKQKELKRKKDARQERIERYGPKRGGSDGKKSFYKSAQFQMAKQQYLELNTMTDSANPDLETQSTDFQDMNSKPFLKKQLERKVEQSVDMIETVIQMRMPKRIHDIQKTQTTQVVAKEQAKAINNLSRVVRIKTGGELHSKSAFGEKCEEQKKLLNITKYNSTRPKKQKNKPILRDINIALEVTMEEHHKTPLRIHEESFKKNETKVSSVKRLNYSSFVMADSLDQLDQQSPKGSPEFRNLDSIILPGRTEKYDHAIHGHPPKKKEELRYTKIEAKDDQERSKKVILEQEEIPERRIQKSKDQISQSGQKSKSPSPQKKQTSDIIFKYFFDPFRLKLIMLDKTEASPFGKNPDYFFVSGLNHYNKGDIHTALAHFKKGVSDKETHFLCRFNLGFIKFILGDFTEAQMEYQTLLDQTDQLGIHPKAKIPLILYNKAVCELQCGSFILCISTVERCLVIMKQREKQESSFTNLVRRDQDLMISILQIQGVAFFRIGELLKSGDCFDQSNCRKAFIAQLQEPDEDDTHSRRSNFIQVANIDENSRFIPLMRIKESPVGEELGLNTPLIRIEGLDVKGNNAHDEMTPSIRQHKNQSLLFAQEPPAFKDYSQQSNVSAAGTDKLSTPQNKRISLLSKVKYRRRLGSIISRISNNELDLSKIQIENRRIKSHSCLQSECQIENDKLDAFLKDIHNRLIISELAAKEGKDEIKAFIYGNQRQERLSIVEQSTQQLVQSSRATQRDMKLNTNTLEMEVEKDLTHIKNLIIKKKEFKKKQSDYGCIVTRREKKKFEAIFEKLEESDVYQDELINKLMKLLMRLPGVKKTFDETKLRWMLQHTSVKYLIKNKGDILYEQNKSLADSSFILVQGKVTIVKTIHDFELLFKEKLEENLWKLSIEAQQPSAQQSQRLILQPESTSSQKENRIQFDKASTIKELTEDYSSSSQKLSSSADKHSFDLSLQSQQAKQLRLNLGKSPSQSSEESSQCVDQSQYDRFFKPIDTELQRYLDADKVQEHLCDEKEPCKMHREKVEKPKEEFIFNYISILRKKQARCHSAVSSNQLKRLQNNEAAMAKFEKEVTQKALLKYGIHMDLPPRNRFEQSNLNITFVHQNHYQGHIFSRDIIVERKKMKYQDMLMEDLGKMIRDKTQILKYIQKVRKQEAEHERRELEELNKMSSIKKQQILRQVNEHGGSPFLKSQKTLSTLMRMLSKRFPNQGFQQRASLTSEQNQTHPMGLTSNSESNQSPKARPSLALQKQETEDLKFNSNKLSKKIEEMQKGKEKKNQSDASKQAKLMEETSDEDNADQKKEFNRFKQNSTCLVMEDSTLIIRIPFWLERAYKHHVRELEREKMEL